MKTHKNLPSLSIKDETVTVVAGVVVAVVAVVVWVDGVGEIDVFVKAIVVDSVCMSFPVVVGDWDR